MSTKLFFLTMAAILLAGLLFLVSAQLPQFALAEQQSARAADQPDPYVTAFEEGGIAAPAASFALVNQPWDWIEGRTTPGAIVQGTLVRDNSPYATAQTVAESDGWFAFQFLEGDAPVDILEGDTVEVADGNLNASIDVITIQGTIDVTADTVSGQMSSGVFPANGMVGVGRPSDTVFTTHTITVAVDGTYAVDFSGEVDIQNGFVAKVWYTNPDGNQVRKILYSSGLDVRARLTEDLVEGVTVPGTTVQITVTNSSGAVKGTAIAMADRSGHYKTQVLNNLSPIDIAMGDKVIANALDETAQILTSVRHVSRINPTDDTVSGQLIGGVFPASGRVDLWHADTNTWYHQDIQTDDNGNYLANFGGVVDLKLTDRILVWYIYPDGNQVASAGSGLEIGVSTSTDLIWGYTTPGREVNITVRANPGGSISGTATALVDENGFFETSVNEPSPLDLLSGQEVNVATDGLESSLIISQLRFRPNLEDQTISIIGSPDAILHVELHRLGASTTIETTTNETGHALVEVDGGYDLQAGDRLDLTFYQVTQGHTLHQAFRIELVVFLPILLKGG